MPYPTSGATIRHDLNVVVEEARAADQFFIGDRILPPYGVDAKEGIYPKLTIATGALLESVAVDRARGGSYGQITREWGTDTYACADRGVEEPVDDTDVKDLARFFSVESAVAGWLLRSIKLAQEVRVAAAINSTANFGAATNSAVAYTEANIATIDLPQDIIAAVERVNDKANQANTIVIGATVFARLRRSTLLKNFLLGSLAGQIQTPVSAANVAAAFRDFGIENCFIGRARYNAAKKGQAYSAANVWGTTYVWVGDVKMGDPFAGGAGRILTWNAEGGLYVAETYREESRRSNMLRVRQNTIEKIIDGTAGTLIATQWS